jgi:hypothetical protein
MNKIKRAVNSSLFKSSVCLVIGLTLLLEKLPLYAGIALGFSFREFLLAFKHNS